MKIIKRSLQLFLVLMVTLSIFPAVKTLADTKAVTTYDLNLRAEAAWDAEQIGVIPNGDLITLLVKGGVWSKIDYDGTIGYVPTQYITQWGFVEEVRYATSTDEVNLRKAANADSAVLKVIDEGTKLKVKGVNGDYLKLEADGIVGYSSAKYWDDTNAKATVEAPTSKKITIVTEIYAYPTADLAKAGGGSSVVYPAGKYVIFKTDADTEMINISTKAGTAGGWVNPADNVETDEPPAEQVKTYEVVVEVPSYGTALDAKNRTNPTGWKAVGDYYVFKEELGMKNITMAQTTPGAWINPLDNDIAKPLAASNVMISSMDGVNLRDKPDIDGEIVLAVETGTKARVVIPAVKGWLKLEINGVQGYSWSAYWSDAAAVKVDNPFATPDYENLSLTMVGQLRTQVTASLRQNPSETSPLLVGRIPSGSILVKLTAQGALDPSWYYVSYMDPQGKEWKGYIKTIEADPIKSFAEPANPTNGNKLVVYLDPGHRAVGTGAVGGDAKTPIDEVTINWNISLKAKALLEARGYTVYLSKDNLNDDSDLYDRITEANQLEADIYVSIHCNASTSKQASGTITFYSSEKLYPSTTNWLDNSILLSQYLAESVGQVMGKSKVVDDVPGTGGSYAINRLSDMPSSLLELGFLTNKTDSVILAASDNWDKLALQIADGIDRYFGIQ